MSLPIPTETIYEYLSESLIKVLGTMAHSECVPLSKENYSGRSAPSPRFESGGAPNISMYAASVGFAGELNGICCLFLSDPFALHISHKITGIDSSELDEDTVRDVCGELTNMFAGGFKSALADLGMPSTLTLPTVLHGGNLAISPTGAAEHHRFSFEVDGYSIKADLLLATR